MRDTNDDILNDGPTGAAGSAGNDGAAEPELASLLDRLGAAERAAWSAADSARIAAATFGMIEPEEPSAVIGAIGPAGPSPAKRLGGGMGWLAGLAAAAAVGLIIGVGAMLSQPMGPTGAESGGALAMNTDAQTVALDDESLEEELSAWVSSRVRLDPAALLSMADEAEATASALARDSLDEIETDLASFWTIRSGFAGVDDDGLEAEGTL